MAAARSRRRLGVLHVRPFRGLPRGPGAGRRQGVSGGRGPWRGLGRRQVGSCGPHLLPGVPAAAGRVPSEGGRGAGRGGFGTLGPLFGLWPFLETLVARPTSSKAFVGL